jgi:hypothetical protein
MKTLGLRTVNDDPVHEDSKKQATLDSTKGPCIEAREGQHSNDKTEAIRKGASELLGINCVWVEEEEGTHEIQAKLGNLLRSKISILLRIPRPFHR